MARTLATNFTSTLQFPKATAATDLFKKEDVQTLAEAVDQHDHSSGKGVVVNVAGIAAGAINGSQITDNTITSAKITDGTIATADLANAAVTNAKLGSDTARANLLTNGGFEVWQRGNGPFTANGVMTADRWAIGLVGTDTMSISRDSTNIDTPSGSKVAAACTFVLGSGAGVSNLLHQLKADTDYVGLTGRTLSLSIRVRTSAPNAVRIAINNFYSGTSHYTYSAFHTGGGTYETLTVSAAIDPTATYVQIAVFFAASCTAYVDSAMLVVGAQPADYAPLHPADDLARCQRYYEVIGDTAGYPVIGGYAGAGGLAFTNLLYKQNKAITPTVTKIGTWTTVNAGQPTLSTTNLHGLAAYVTVTALGYGYANPGAAGQDFTIEANP